MKHWFANLKVRYKLLTGMIFITSAALILITQLSYSYFYKRNTNEVYKKAERSIQMTGSSLSSQFMSLSTATDHLLVKEPFPQMISDINNRNFTGYAKYFSEAMSQTDSFLQSHDLINNVILCGEDGILFSPASLGMSSYFETLFTENIWEYPHITIFPTRFNSMFKQGSTIPISYPVSYSPASANLAYQDAPGTKKARFILLIDTAQIRAYFDRMSNSYTYCMYLAKEDGVPLDITDAQFPDAFLPEVKDWVAGKNGPQSGTVKNQKEELFLEMDSIKFCSLKIVHMVKKSSLTGDIKELRSFFILVWLACFAASGLLSFALSHLLTRNLKSIGKVIGRINENAYNKKVTFPYTDEIGLLGTQLNQMYDTIQLQLKQIKDEEQKKAKAEIQMMSEQINPHFLYNTLECIHFQVLNGHSDTAGGMLESLGRYLRITLSVGKTFISVQKEVEHVTSYMEIMNRHSSAGIMLITSIEPGLRDVKIMKVLLQPLAENCIKHGFSNFIGGFEPVPPTISISIHSVSDKQIQIEVSDNGTGIDIEKAVSCLDPEAKNHFGLANLQKRLTACYGEKAKISFTSIPYLKNSVIIEIPLKDN
ncbi:sensor histidine kinase [Clostridium sp. Marseille-P2415]|uniref:sensor histidine kinase n=1 Tax=Clostridium sp. Marseille-P2415 TaxID=1805471 RepID=UPI0009886DB4|nr:histidine kinase [Clostridium sp. Marseille-P2415]